MRLTRCGESDWMRKGFADRAALRLPDPAPTRFEVRNRRPGDRLRPLGAPGMRRLKELLIDRKVPRARRDRIPLLLLDGRIAWVPGVAIAEEFRLQGGGEALVAEWIEGTEPALQRSTFRRGADAPAEDGET
jgi:tRNA(Ile)-lysidine synthetase-like protein